MINKLAFLFFKNPDLATIIEYLTDAYLYSLSEAKKDAAKVCQIVEQIKAKGYELEYNQFWKAYQVHHDEIGLRVFDCSDADIAIDLALRG